jgi:flavin reductase (DIM6/NTAB) family NADH-FMN oxidoreductase RutF
VIAAAAHQLDSTVLRQAFGCFPSGVTAFCGLADGRPEGFAASSFTSVSLEPALVSICVANSSETWPKLALMTRLGISVLAGAQGGVAKAIASKGEDRFAGVPWTTNESGAVFIEGASLWLDCEPFRRLPAGDHEIVLLRILAFEMNPEVTPMVFHRGSFRELAIPA